MSKYILTVTLNPTLDKNICIPDFKTGCSFYQNSEVQNAGGKGLNVSRVLNILKVNNLATGLVGGLTGASVSQLLKQEKINFDFTKIKNNIRTHLTIIDLKNSKRTRVLEEGPKVYPKELAEFKTKFKTLIGDAKMVVIAGRNANGVSPKFYAQLIRLVRRENIPVFLDTSGSPLEEGLKGGVDIVKPNLSEAEELLGQKIRTKKQIGDALHTFHKLGAKVVLLSMAEKGAVLSDGKNILKAVSSKIKVQNDVGCGDALSAGFIDAWMKGLSLGERLQWAVALGTANAVSLKPGEISRKTINDILKNIRTESFL